MAAHTSATAAADRNGWAVLLEVGTGTYAYGPFEEETLASQFSAYLCAEVDPASVVPLSEVGPARPGIVWRSAVAELLNWRGAVADERHERLTEVALTVDRMLEAGHISPAAAAEVRFAAGVITRTQLNEAIDAARGEGR